MAVKKMIIKRHDRQPYYRFSVPVDLAGATILATMIAASTGVPKFTRQACVITDAAAGEAEYRWADGDTDTAGRYLIEFEVSPSAAGKFTVPVEPAMVEVLEDADGV